MVRTSPAFTACPGAVSRTPLMRTWPASTSAAALERAFTTRACHSHLSRRWRSNAFPLDAFSSNASGLILAVGGELLFQRRELCKGRIGIDGPIAVARRG